MPLGIQSDSSFFVQTLCFEPDYFKVWIPHPAFVPLHPLDSDTCRPSSISPPISRRPPPQGPPFFQPDGEHDGGVGPRHPPELQPSLFPRRLERRPPTELSTLLSTRTTCQPLGAISQLPSPPSLSIFRTRQRPFFVSQVFRAKRFVCVSCRTLVCSSSSVPLEPQSLLRVGVQICSYLFPRKSLPPRAQQKLKNLCGRCHKQSQRSRFSTSLEA